MINQEDLENIGFKTDAESKSLYDGKMTKFHKRKDNGHIIAGHDATDIFITKEMQWVTIEIDHQSSWDYSGKKLVFKGWCDNIDFLQQILNSVAR